MNEMNDFEKKFVQYSFNNHHYMEVFLVDLAKEHLSIQTINKHTYKIDMYLNKYLLSADNAYSMKEGARMVQGFLKSDYISHKPSSIRTTTTSIKKFYKSMFENGEIGKDDYDYVIEDIKNNLKDWIKMCE